MHSRWISLKPTMALSIYDLRPTVSIYDFPDENTSCSGFSEGSCQIQTVPTWSLGLVNVADEHTLYSYQTMHIECKYKDCKMLDVNACVVYISTGEGTQASIKNPGLVNMVWRRGVNFLSHSRPQQPIVTKSNLQPYTHQGTIMTCLFTKWPIR